MLAGKPVPVMLTGKGMLPGRVGPLNNDGNVGCTILSSPEHGSAAGTKAGMFRLAAGILQLARSDLIDNL